MNANVTVLDNDNSLTFDDMKKINIVNLFINNSTMETERCLPLRD